MDKIIVAFAGPLFSFLLAVVFAFIVWGVGKPEAQMTQTKTVGYVSEESPADEAGFKAGDEIVSVAGKEIIRFHGLIDSVDWNFITSPDAEVPVVINRPGAGEMTLSLKKDLDAMRAAEAAKNLSWWKRTMNAIFNRSQLPDTGLRGKENPMVAEVSAKGPAAAVGVQKNDVILKIDGNDVTSRHYVSDYIDDHRDKELELLIQRGDEEVTIKVTPAAPSNLAELPAEAQEALKDARFMGIGWDDYGISAIAHPTPVEQVTDGLRVIVSTLKAVGSKGTGVNAGHLSGPVGIMRLYYRLFEHPDGWRLVLWFSVILNINLAVLNMLPLPVLDGGHITMALIEAITRKPINFRVLEIIQTACVVLLLGFMAFVTLKDAGDLFGGGKKIELEFGPPAAAAPAAPAASE